jgi:sensor c-di-GMP phosphodiesterase-like protein
MIQDSLLHLKLARLFSALLTALSIIIAGTLATAWQVRESGRQDAVSASRRAVLRIESLLDEAESAALQARDFLAFPCSPSVRSELNRLTIRLPHLRVISLLQEGKLTCSSFSASVPRIVDTSQYAENRLSLRQGSVITPDTPLLILLKSFPEGTVSVSIGITHLTDILTLLGTHTPLNLRVGKQILSLDGGILTGTPGKDVRQVYSTQYPFSVEYTGPTALSYNLLIGNGKILFALFSVIALLAGAMIWRFTFRLPTPYDQLTQAISRGEIIPWYQPVVCSRTGDITGAEVLARWKHRTGVYIPPDVFIPQAEQSGLIIPLTRQLMTRAAAELTPIINRLRQPFHLAFNISAAHIRSGQLTVVDFRQFLHTFPKGSILLVAEITEREPFEQSPDLRKVLHELRNEGIQIALDDFGTGYSNLGYLNTLPIDYLKIDRSFVSRLSEEEGSDQLIECVIDMARTLGLGLVAEGVETRYQADWLAKHKVDILQGYYFSRALPVEKFIQMSILQARGNVPLQK